MDEQLIAIFDQSLRRCDNDPKFLDTFYERFLASSPKVQEKFANTDFAKQKRLLRASFYLILLASEDPEKVRSGTSAILPTATVPATSTSEASSTISGWTAYSRQSKSVIPTTAPRWSRRGSR